MIDINENLEVGSQYDAAQQVIMDGVFPPPFMKNMGDAAMDEFERIFDQAMIFLYGEPCPNCGCPSEHYDGHACEDYNDN